MLERYESAAAMVGDLRPDSPVYGLRPHALTATARRFVEGFPGAVLYAVKCNDDPRVLDALAEGGVRHFDVASMGELEAVRSRFGEAECHFMHPVKSRADIARAYRVHGVRVFALDCTEELAKIVEETGDADDLELMIRLDVPRGAAVQDLGGKFGASVPEAARLLADAARTAEGRTRKVGLTFHVGSQCLNPLAWRRAIELADAARRLAGVEIAALDVGGGFPAPYVGVEPPPLQAFVAEIRAALADHGFGPEVRLACEPGRALVAEGLSVIVRVVLRKDDALYVTDGVYGALSELRLPGIRLPVRLIRSDGATAGPVSNFRLFGPTCDPIDEMVGPFTLPDDAREGDWIEIGQCGAYSTALNTGFNGFGRGRFVALADPPLRPSYAERARKAA